MTRWTQRLVERLVSTYLSVPDSFASSFISLISSRSMGARKLTDGDAATCLRGCVDTSRSNGMHIMAMVKRLLNPCCRVRTAQVMQ